MSESLNNAVNRNLAYQGNFEIVFSAFPGVEYHCTSVSFPGINVGSPKQSNPMLRIPQAGDHLEFDPLTITFNVDENLKNYFELYERLIKVAPIDKLSTFENLADGSVIGDAKITILSNNKQPIKVIDFIGLIPTNLSGLEFTTQNEEDQPLTATATFEFVSFKEDTNVTL